VAHEIKKMAREEFQDFNRAFFMLTKETGLALSIFLAVHFLDWVFGWFSRSSATDATVNFISNVGVILLFLALVSKDIWKYMKR
jgi:succinate dehydrogenase/fumarate reductase cytochrome b subunit